MVLDEVKMYYLANRRRKAVSSAVVQSKRTDGAVLDRVAGIVSEEVKQIVLSVVHKLPPEHRAVLTMRCYEQLSFSQIAEQLGCRGFRARFLFSRTEKDLSKNLVKNGLGKEALLGALLIFGKMTATSEASAANISITGMTQSLA